MSISNSYTNNTSTQTNSNQDSRGLRAELAGRIEEKCHGLTEKMKNLSSELAEKVSQKTEQLDAQLKQALMEHLKIEDEDMRAERIEAHRRNGIQNHFNNEAVLDLLARNDWEWRQMTGQMRTARYSSNTT